ncbi:MAG TPA: xanthine dehydrogenase family protein subunit M [Anaerolineae bacterium]|nr:xanthine dehydrogenase family protein subunit M [Anaerolineae bacterium]
MLPEFELLMPRTLSEALEVLAQAREGVAPVAGGTNLVVDMRGGRHRPSVLVSVAGLEELRGVRRENGHIVIGATTTVAELLEEPLIAEAAPALWSAARVFANPLVRNRATVGGNLADASPAADTAPPLLVLDAEVQLTSKEGSRWVPLDEFFLGVRQTLRQPDELLTAIRFPLPPSGAFGGFYKLGLRKADAISVASVAVLVEVGEDGTCRKARIAMGAVAPKPIRAYEAEKRLEGHVLTPELAAEAAHLCAEATSPIDDIRASAAYRKHVVEILARRLLSEERR